MSDLVARLRQVKSARQQGFYTIHEPDALANEAADVIEAQAAQIAALQAQLAEALDDAAKLVPVVDDIRHMSLNAVETLLAERRCAIRALKGE